MVGEGLLETVSPGCYGNIFGYMQEQMNNRISKLQEKSTHSTPVCAIQHGIWHLIQGFQTRGQACGRRPHYQDSTTITYASVMSRETVRIALMIATLNDLEVKQVDILNVHVQANVTEKVWTTLGLEFGKDASKTAVLVWAFYGQKSAGAAFRSHLVRCMESMVYESCKANPYLWLNQRPNQKMGYSISPIYCAMWTNALCIHHSANGVLQQLHQFFPLKPGYGSPDMYLGAKLCKARLHNGVWAGAMSPRKYVHEAMRNCNAHLVTFSDRLRLPRKAENPFKMVFKPALDVSPE